LSGEQKRKFRSFVFVPISVLTIKKINYIFSKQIKRRKTNDKLTNKQNVIRMCACVKKTKTETDKREIGYFGLER
jgi:hypothetical protein